jgi:2-C-methyl-D-erythritol 4-phosphate cytidylyltransferase/2-C-methyl-D-erythritol 2,4-cyclodiphosphate synthase
MTIPSKSAAKMHSDETKVAVILPAAGRGSRVVGHDPRPKQYRPLAGACSLARVIRVFRDHPRVSNIVVAIHPDDVPLFLANVGDLTEEVTVVTGGESRQASIRNSLEILRLPPESIVLIHDAARPFVSRELIDRAIAAAQDTGAAVPVTKVVDTVIGFTPEGFRGTTFDRDLLRGVQTPQSFRLDMILGAHRAAAEASFDSFTDDGALMAWHGHQVALFEGDAENLKLTTADDLVAAERRFALDRLLAHPDVRTGSGFDVHAFGPGDHVILGGIVIPHNAGLVGHSDADVVLHALTDAILGALGDGDIGAHFPPSDNRWRGADSGLFLQEAMDKVAARGGVVSHLDTTVICEAPKIGPHREDMRLRIAHITGLTIGQVSVKATTTERLGFAGRGEGIAALATATVRLPFTHEAMEHAGP